MRYQIRCFSEQYYGGIHRLSLDNCFGPPETNGGCAETSQQLVAY